MIGSGMVSSIGYQIGRQGVNLIGAQFHRIGAHDAVCAHSKVNPQSWAFG